MANLFHFDEIGNFDFLQTPDRWAEVVRTTIPPGELVSQLTKQVSRNEAVETLRAEGEMIIWGYIEWKDAFRDSRLHYRYWCFRLNPIRTKTDLAFKLPENYRSDCNRSE